MQYFFPQFGKANEQIRSPRFAGSWYPAAANTLDPMLSNYLQEAKFQLSNLPANERPDKNVLAIIAPHAGYMYSGKTAAFVYAAYQVLNASVFFFWGPVTMSPLLEQFYRRNRFWKLP